jgi:hypothetical protein
MVGAGPGLVREEGVHLMLAGGPDRCQPAMLDTGQFSLLRA